MMRREDREDAEAHAELMAWQHGNDSKAFKNTVARNAYIDAYRKGSRMSLRGLLNQTDYKELPSWDGGILEVELRIAVEQALEVLPPAYRQAILVRLVYPERTNQEYADMLGLTKPAYTSRFRRAVKKLMEVLQW